MTVHDPQSEPSRDPAPTEPAAADASSAAADASSAAADASGEPAASGSSAVTGHIVNWAKLEAEHPVEVREGSPFKPEPHRPGDEAPIQATLVNAGEVAAASSGADVVDSRGVVSETANSSILASAVILPFAWLSAVWFPAGTILVGGLGMLLGLFGIASPRQKLSAVVLALHLFAFGWAYTQLL
jgi:hypothetical protein